MHGRDERGFVSRGRSKFFGRPRTLSETHPTDGVVTLTVNTDTGIDVEQIRLPWLTVDAQGVNN